MKKATSIAKADSTWTEWRGFLVGEAAAGRAERKGSDGWTLAEATAHVARWQAWAAVRMRGVLAGERMERLNVDGRNAAWAVADRSVDFATALERMDVAWEELRRTAAAIPDAQWRRLVNSIFAANTWEHYEEHLAWRATAGVKP